MTGWRVGYGAGPKPLIAAMNMIQSQSTTHTSSISQAAAVAALNGAQDFIAANNAVFKERRDLGSGMLNQAAGAGVHPGRRAPFTSIRRVPAPSAGQLPRGKTIASDDDFVAWLLEAEGVACVQGSVFGLSPYFRISYATSTALLEEACRRIQRACAALR